MDRQEIFNDIERWVKDGEYGRHSDFQIQHFIAGKEAINDFAGYKQMLREIDTRYSNMKNDMLEIKKLEIKIKQLDNTIALNNINKSKLISVDDNEEELRLKKLNVDLENEALDLEKNEHYNRVKQLENSLMKNYKELDRFYTLAKHFESKVKEKEANGQSIQDQETEYWEKKFELHAYTNMLGTGGLMDSIISLPKASQEKVLEYMKNASATARSQGFLPAPEFLSKEESMLINDDVLALHDGSGKKDFYALEAGNKTDGIQLMLESVESED